MYRAIANFNALPHTLYPLRSLDETLSRRPRRRVSTVRRSRECNLVRPCALASQITRMMLFNGCSAALSAVAAVMVWTGTILSIVTMPFCGCGVTIFNELLHIVFYLCCTDVFVYNALAASAAECIDMDLAEWRSIATSSELHYLLPVRVSPLPVARRDRIFYPCPRFERSLGTTSPRLVLATVYFGCFKVLVGAGQVLSVVLVLGALGFLIGDKRVPIHLEALTSQHPFAVYTISFGLLLLALALLHGMTRVAKVTTRFFCCEADVGWDEVLQGNDP